MLRRFILTSLIAHTVLLVTLRTNEPPLPMATQRLVINLIAEPHQTKATLAASTVNRVSGSEISSEKKRPVRQTSKTGRKLQNRPAKTVAAVDTQPTLEAATPLSVLNVSSTHQQNAADQLNKTTRIKAQLLLALRDHYSYPKIARRYGWEGLVEMHIRVEADGRVSQVQLLHSSGYDALDQAALNSTRRITMLVEAAGWLHGTFIDVSLPVKYQLIDG